MTTLLTWLGALLAMMPVFNQSHVHTLICSPAGGGKTTCLIINNVLAWRDGSLFCFDPKGEIYRNVVGYRESLGRRVLRMDPFHVCGPGGATINVLDGLSYRQPHFLPEIRALVESLVIKDLHDQNPYFNDVSVGYMAAVLADTVRFRPAAERNLQTFRSVLCYGPGLIEVMLRLAGSNDEFLCRAAGKMGQHRDRELFSVLSTCQRHTDFLDDPLTGQFTQQSSFPLAKALRDGRTDLFFILPPQYLKSHSRLSRLILTACLRTLVRAGEDRHRQCLFVLDELPSLGKLDILSEAICQLRGFGLRTLLAVQALAQLEQQFPEGQHLSVLANCDQLYLGIRDLATAKTVSEMAGSRTARTYRADFSRNGGFSQGRESSASSGWSRSAGESEVAELLLRPEDVLQLDRETMVAFLQQRPPFLLQACPYYRDNAWSEAAQGLTVRERLACLFALVLAVILTQLVGSWSEEAARPPRPPAIRLAPAAPHPSPPVLTPGRDRPARLP
jgi:type IV secretion system protein VirD4